MTLKRIQKEHTEWSKHNFGKPNADHALFGVTEELGELAHAHLKHTQGIRGEPEQLIAEAKDAVGDILIFMMDYCTARGWDMEDVLVETWDVVKTRDWKKFPTNGRTE